MHKNLLSALFILLSAIALQAQRIDFDPDDILVGNRKQPEVLLVGTFHFAYYNEDAHKTTTENQVNVLSPKRQKEMLELLEYIYKFKPTKIVVEDFNKDNILMKNYRAYKSGSKKLDRDEVEQIGYRLMDKFKLDTIYGLDARTLLQDLRENPQSRPYVDSLMNSQTFNDVHDDLYKKWFEQDDQLILKHKLLDYFKHLNSDKFQKREFGSLLTSYLKTGNSAGADAIALSAYSRNLRIFQKIQSIATSPNDRILVLFGSGHTNMLKLFFESSPEFKLVKFNDL